MPRIDQLDELLERTEHKLRAELDDVLGTRQVLEELSYTLGTHRLLKTEPEWREVVARCRLHPLTELLREDPFTRHAAVKPRGYPGDAPLMDMIYGVEDGLLPPATTAAGRVVFDYMIHGPACAGVRARRALVAAHIDRLAERQPYPHVLSIAAGHLREASMSVALRRRRAGRMLALDADPLSLEEVRASYGGLGVETETASFRHLLGKDRYQEAFDFVYSTGLFDYLSPRSGRRLVTAMHGMVRPGGSFLIANFLPGIRDVGYMEAFMDWKLVYRTRQDMVELTRDLPESAIKQVELWAEEAVNILFLRITKH